MGLDFVQGVEQYEPPRFMNAAKLTHLTAPVPVFAATRFKAYVAPFREPLFGNHLEIALFDGVIYQQSGDTGIDPLGGAKALSWLRHGGTVLVLPGPSAVLSSVEACFPRCTVHQLQVALPEREEPAWETGNEPVRPAPGRVRSKTRPQIVDGLVSTVAAAPPVAFWAQKPPPPGGAMLRPPPCACCR